MKDSRRHAAHHLGLHGVPYSSTETALTCATLRKAVAITHRSCFPCAVIIGIWGLPYCFGLSSTHVPSTWYQHTQAFARCAPFPPTAHLFEKSWNYSRLKDGMRHETIYDQCSHIPQLHPQETHSSALEWISKQVAWGHKRKCLLTMEATTPPQNEK